MVGRARGPRGGLVGGTVLAQLVMSLIVVTGIGVDVANAQVQPASVQATQVPGQNYTICDQTAQYLTSPWTYDSLASGSQTYTVAQYQALHGYGTTLPPLPSYILGESPTTMAAIIFAPGSAGITFPAFDFPVTPLLYFFEGGTHGELDLQSVSGDEFIGGSAPGYPEPAFNDGGAAGGIEASNDTYSFSGGASTLANAADPGASTITMTSNVTNYASSITFADGSTSTIVSATGASVTFSPPLTSAQAEGSAVWMNSTPPVSQLRAGIAQGSTTVTLGSSTTPLVPWQHVVIGTQDYEVSAVSGSQSGYTLTIPGGLDFAAAANTPVYYNSDAGGVTVEYLDISDDLHSTTGTLTLGSGWTVAHNKIHDSYAPGEGVAYYGGDESTIEYNCFSKMGIYAGGGTGTHTVFDYNEVYRTPMEPDPGCGCSGGGKWWGTLNADIVDNAFIENGVGGGQPAVWLDNGNSGTLVSGNYFYHNVGTAFTNETGYNSDITDNLFQNDNWGTTGSGCGNSNCAGDVILNSSGGFDVPGSRYNNQMIITGNQFINDWGGITIWESGLRNCAASGEGWPIDSAYCSGGFPTTETTAAGGQYYFSHVRDSAHGDTTSLDQTVSAGSTTVMVRGAEAINDQIGFSDPSKTTTTSTDDVSTLTGSSTLAVASTTSFPSSGQLRVDTSAAGGGGGLTGAILSYTGTSPASFTGVALVRGSGTLSGPILEVQPYQVLSETCYSNDCSLTVSPPIANSVPAGAEVTSAGTCALFATSTASPTTPLAPDGTSYYDGCQWGTKHISVSGNDFLFDPAYIAASTTATGYQTTCTADNANNCGTNFMQFQAGGTLPYNTMIDGNSMMSSSTFTGCPAWDSGCTADPLNNINALSVVPFAPANNGEEPTNDIWSDNTYFGPWAWNAYNYGPCDARPSDPTTGEGMPADACFVNFDNWQGYWQQDSGSTYSPVVPDDDLVMESVPADITTTASGPNGAVVTYAPPIAVDEDGASSPSVTCTPPSGATFPIGTTAVTCTATDPDDSNSPLTATFTVTVQWPPAPGPTFTLQPGSGNNVGVAADGSVWVIGTNPTGGGYGIYHWTGQGWAAAPGGAIDIAVAANGNPWVVNSAHRIYHWNGSAWASYPGAAFGVGVGANGSVWVIGTNPTGGGYGIYHWTGQGWAAAPGGAIDIAVAANGNPWVVNSAHRIYHWNGSAWASYPGAAFGVGVGANGSVWVIGTNPTGGGYGIYHWTGQGWAALPGGGVDVAVAANGNPWVINSAHRIYSS